MQQLSIPAHEQGTTRLFALSMDAAAARGVRSNLDEQAALLGLEDIQATGVEVFRIADLGDLGLAGYLTEGIDAQATDIARDRSKLAALDGWVMLLHSSALGGKAVTLKLAPELTLIGTYRQESAESTPIDISSEAAEPYTGTPAPQAPARNRKGGSIVVLGLGILVLLVLWWAVG